MLAIVTIVPWNEPESQRHSTLCPSSGSSDCPAQGIHDGGDPDRGVLGAQLRIVFGGADVRGARGRGFAPKIVARRARGVPVAAVLASTIWRICRGHRELPAPESGIFDFIMNSAGLVALFVYAFIALTQIHLRKAMSDEEVAL